MKEAWYLSAAAKEDYTRLLENEKIPWERLRGKTVLITGATGLIGGNLTFLLLEARRERVPGLTVRVLVRDLKKAEVLFPADPHLELICASVEDARAMQDIAADYIIHGASPTASAFFVEHPVETIRTAVDGTMNLLELARKCKAEGFVYLSSMEAYGEVREEVLLAEGHLGLIDPRKVRNCYPESKRTCEALCAAYASEYQVPAVAIRLAQTFGIGVPKEDKRVFAMMARCALAGEDIVLQTKGESRHPYLYTADAVSAILTVLLKGMPGEIYNAANPDTYCSIWEMGELVAREFGQNGMSVRTAEQGDVSKYPAPSFLKLDTSALEQLGWQAETGLKEMYRRMLMTM